MPLTGLTTLGALVTAAALRADQPTPSTTTFITTANWYTFVNGSCQALHDKLIEAYGADYRVTLSSSITATTAATYALPDSFYKLLGVDQQVSSAAGNDGWTSVPRFNFADRNRYAMAPLSMRNGIVSTRYRLSGDNIWFTPQPPVGTVFKLWYAPRFTPMTADGDTFDGVDGWEEWVINDAAMKALVKEESDISGLQALQQVQNERLATIMENRDAGSPSTTVDVYARNATNDPFGGDGGWW